MEWPIGHDLQPIEAKGFYGIIAFATLVGAGIDFTPIDPIKALIWAAVLNGVVAVPIMIVMMRMAVRPEIMGAFVIKPPSEQARLVRDRRHGGHRRRNGRFVRSVTRISRAAARLSWCAGWRACRSDHRGDLMNPLLRLRSMACVVAMLLIAGLAATGATAADTSKAGADSNPFPAAKRAAIDAAFTKTFTESKAPGAIVGIWIAR